MDIENSEGKEFLGSGIAFPLNIDEQGHISMNSLEEQVRQSILLILRTAKGERVMRHDFGAGLHRLVFSPSNYATFAMVEHEVKDALVRFEPRIDVLNVKVTPYSDELGKLEPEKLDIYLEYRVRKTDTMFNLVYPFYLERGTL